MNKLLVVSFDSSSRGSMLSILTFVRSDSPCIRVVDPNTIALLLHFAGQQFGLLDISAGAAPPRRDAVAVAVLSVRLAGASNLLLHTCTLRAGKPQPYQRTPSFLIFFPRGERVPGNSSAVAAVHCVVAAVPNTQRHLVPDRHAAGSPRAHLLHSQRHA